MVFKSTALGVEDRQTKRTRAEVEENSAKPPMQGFINETTTAGKVIFLQFGGFLFATGQ